MKKQWALIALAAILFGINPASSISAQQKRSRSAAAVRNPRLSELVSITQLKEAFQRDAGKVRLVALLSPT
jgi:hypothetical protein